MQYRSIQLIVCLIGTLFVILLYANVIRLLHCKDTRHTTESYGVRSGIIEKQTVVPVFQDLEVADPFDNVQLNDSSFSNKISFESFDWEDIYDQNKLFLKTNYNVPLRQPALTPSLFSEVSSSLSIHSDSSGFSLLHMKNVCYDSTQTSPGIQLYCLDNCDGLQKSISDLPSYFGEWKFYVQQKQLDLSTTPLFLQDDGSYLYIPDREDYEKISLDISSFIIHLVQSIPSLPVVRRIMIPLPQKKSSSFSSILYKGIREFLPDTTQFRFFWKEGLEAINTPLCFSNLRGIGPLSWIDPLSLFISPMDVSLLRSAVYKSYSIHLSGRRWKFTRTLLMHSSKSTILGMDGIRDYFKKNGNWWFFEQDVNAMSAEEELEMMIDTDVIISITTSDLYHILFLLPGSAIIAYHYPYDNDASWSQLAEVSQLAYYPVFNTSIPLPKNCKGNPLSKVCRSALHKQPIFINFQQIHNILRVASIHVHMNKYTISM